MPVYIFVSVIPFDVSGVKVKVNETTIVILMHFYLTLFERIKHQSTFKSHERNKLFGFLNGIDTDDIRNITSIAHDYSPYALSIALLQE